MRTEFQLQWTNQEKLFDLIELLYRDVVYEYEQYRGEQDQEAGRSVFRRPNLCAWRCGMLLRV